MSKRQNKSLDQRCNPKSVLHAIEHSERPPRPRKSVTFLPASSAEKSQSSPLRRRPVAALAEICCRKLKAPAAKELRAAFLLNNTKTISWHVDICSEYGVELLRLRLHARENMNTQRRNRTCCSMPKRMDWSNNPFSTSLDHGPKASWPSESFSRSLVHHTASSWRLLSFSRHSPVSCCQQYPFSSVASSTRFRNLLPAQSMTMN